MLLMAENAVVNQTSDYNETKKKKHAGEYEALTAVTNDIATNA